jgi:zinc-ribbon domain
MHSCRSCGKQVADGTPFCPNCGANQAPGANAGPTSTEQVGGAQPSAAAPGAVAPKKKRRIGRKLGLGCGGLILLIVIVAVIGAAAGGSSSSSSSPTDTPQPQSAPAAAGATDTPQPAPAAGSSHQTFADGQQVVGTDIQPGTYRTRTGSSGCYWEREKDFSNNLGSILANDNTDAPAVVTILATDKGFKSTNCGTWTDDLSAITSDPTSFGDGTYIVGTDIQAGTYRSSGQSSCYWERESDFTGGGVGSIIANDNTDTPAVVTIDASDKGFKSHNCGTWTKAG